MADWRLDQKTEETPQGTDLSLLVRGTSVFKTTFQKIKEFIIGTTVMGTTATDVTGAVKELNDKIGSEEKEGSIISQLNDLMNYKYAKYTRKGNQGLGHGTWVNIQWDNKIYDTNNFIDMSSISNSEKINIKDGGLYIINVEVKFEFNPNGVRAIKIIKDDTEEIAYVNKNSVTQDLVPDRLQLTTVAYLNANEYLNIAIYQGSGSGMVIEDTSTKFSISKIGGQYA